MRYLCFLALLSLLLSSAQNAPENHDRLKKVSLIKTGMRAQEVRGLLGQPDHVARQILYRRFRDQWRYLEPAGLWIEFDCLKGQDPEVIAIHLPDADRPREHF
jgi:hypothetical protein